MDRYKSISTLVLIVLFLVTIVSTPSCGRIKKTIDNLRGNSEINDEDILNVKKGISNCYGYVWWQLTGDALYSVEAKQLEAELKRRGYRAFVGTHNGHVPLCQEDVVMFSYGNTLSHGAIVFSDSGNVSHFRETMLCTVIKKTGELIPNFQNRLIVNPYLLDFYPSKYEEILIRNGASSKAINDKESQGSIGFWHQNDSMQEVQDLLYPGKNPKVTVWKHPAKLVIGIDSGITTDSDKTEIYDDESLQLKAYVFYSGVSGYEEVTGVLGQPKVTWADPEIVNGLVRGSYLSPGKNTIKASITIVKPWGVASKTEKAESINKDITLTLQAEFDIWMTSRASPQKLSVWAGAIFNNEPNDGKNTLTPSKLTVTQVFYKNQIKISGDMKGLSPNTSYMVCLAKNPNTDLGLVGVFASSSTLSYFTTDANGTAQWEVELDFDTTIFSYGLEKPGTSIFSIGIIDQTIFNQLLSQGVNNPLQQALISDSFIVNIN
jgi:hypothetical protein